MLKCNRENKIELNPIMSNFDHSIETDIAEQLKSGNYYAGYSAWDFHGDVWYENDQYHCEIWVYGVHIATISNKDIKEVMTEASERFGWK